MPVGVRPTHQSGIGKRLLAAVPALGKLGLEVFPAAGARPRRTRRRRGRTGQRPLGVNLVRILYKQLRPRFHHRQIAQCTGQILVAQLAADTGGNEHVARMRHLQQRRGPVNPFQRSDPRNCATSPPRSKVSTSADPTTTPSTWDAKRLTWSRERIPKPAHTGTDEQRFTRSM